jgi:hypothetical protein
VSAADRRDLLGLAVRFVCTGRGVHRSLELANIVHHGDDPEELAAFIEEFGEEAGRRQYEYERIGYMGSRPGKRGTITQKTQVEFADFVDDRLVSVWLLRCSRCTGQLQLSDDDMRELVESLLRAGGSRYDISNGMPANV